MTLNGIPRVAVVCSLIVASISVVVLVGWLTQTESLARIVPGWVTLKANSALGFLAVASAVVAASRTTGVGASRYQLFAASVAILIGSLALLGWTGVSIDVDELLVRDAWTTASAYPGRPSVTTSVALVLLGAAALPVFDRKPTSAARAALALVAIGIAATVSLTWAFVAGRLFADPAIEPASILSSVCILVSGLGLIALSRLPILGVFLRAGPVGMAARAGFVTAITLPLVLASVGVYAVTSGNVEPVGAIILISMLGAVLALMAAALSASRSAHSQDQLDAATVRMRMSEERSRTTLDQLPDLIVTKDRDGVVTWANAAAERALGVAKDGLVGASWDGLVPNAAAVALADQELRVSHTKCPTRDLVVLTLSGGEARTMDVHLLPVLDADGELGSLLEVLTDVTDARTAQEAQERLAAVVVASQDAIFTVDLEGSVTTWNPAAERILGWAPEEVIGTDGRFISAGGGVGSPHWVTDIDEPDSSGRRVQWLTKEGRAISVRISVSTLRDADGSPTGMSIMASDVTEELARERALRESEASLRTTTQELVRSNQSLREFASATSHDLKEPLRKIRAFGDRLRRREGDQLSEEGRADLARMTDAAERMQDLITDLLDLARVSSAPRAVEEVPLGAIVTDALDDLSEAIEAGGALIEVGALPSLEVDRRQMQRVFQNVIGNSLKFHTSGSTPQIEIGADEPTMGAGDQPEVSVWIQDHGVGFDQRFADRVFQPFERLHGRDAFEGTGIGLAICRQIIEGHGGSIQAKSESGVGTRMTITLPGPRVEGGETGDAS